MAAFNSRGKFPAYDSIIRGQLQFHNCRDNNGIIKKKLLLCTDDGSKIIDCKFGQIDEYVNKISCFYDNERSLPGPGYREEKNSICYYKISDRIRSKLLIARIPYNSTGQPVNYDAYKALINQNHLVRVYVGTCSFKFYIFDPDNEIPNKIGDGGIRCTTGRIMRNASLFSNNENGEIPIGPILEVTIGNRLDVYMLNGIDIFYSSENPNNIPSYIFNPHRDVGWHRIINGEATEGFLLQYTENNELGEPIYSNTPNNIVFVKICINNPNNAIGNPPPTTTTDIVVQNNVESFRQEIETMGYIRNNASDNRLTVFDSVFADSNNVYIISPWRTGGDLFTLANNAGTVGLLNEFHMRIFLKRASLALSSLHAIGVSHNDISMENIISANQDSLQTYVENVCICDFGQAILHVQGQPFTSYRPFGKLVYMPAECLNAAIMQGPLIFGFKIDVYQLGMSCMFALFTHFYNYCFRNQLQISSLFVTPHLLQIGNRLLQFRAYLNRGTLSPEAIQYFNRDTPADIQIGEIIIQFLREVNRACRPDIVLTDEFLGLLSRMLLTDPNSRISMNDVFNDDVLNGF